MRCVSPSGLDDCLQVAPPEETPKLAERLGLDLPDSFAGDRETRADLAKGVLLVVAEAEPEPQHLALPRAQRAQREVDVPGEVLGDQGVAWRFAGAVLQEVPELRVLSGGVMQRQRPTSRLENEQDLLGRDAGPPGQLLRGGSTTEVAVITWLVRESRFRVSTR